jgi:glycosyltransferase A (GT-A) superfamily protein (DUF2064 family)
MKEIFAVFGKMPLKGYSKTRLAKELGEERAFDLYNSFIKDFSANLLRSKFKSIYIFGAPGNLSTEIFFLKEFSQFKINYFPQNELPFFQRLRDVFLKIREKEGDCFIHLTGTDIPDFPFEELEKIDPSKDIIYLGPDIDGGFYYFGAHCKYFDVFGFEFSGSVLESIQRKIEELGYEVTHLKTWSDIDDLKGLLKALERSSVEKISHTRECFRP